VRPSKEIYLGRTGGDSTGSPSSALEHLCSCFLGWDDRPWLPECFRHWPSICLPQISFSAAQLLSVVRFFFFFFWLVATLRVFFSFSPRWPPGSKFTRLFIVQTSWLFSCPLSQHPLFCKAVINQPDHSLTRLGPTPSFCSDLSLIFCQRPPLTWLYAFPPPGGGCVPPYSSPIFEPFPERSPFYTCFFRLVPQAGSTKPFCLPPNTLGHTPPRGLW